MAIYPDSAISYTSYDGDVLTLYPWRGEHVALLTVSNSLNGDVMEDIVHKLDAAYEIYTTITGREPTPYLQYDGLASIAQVPSAFNGNASAIGFLGSTGIEITNGSFEVLYNGVNTSGKFDQVLFYELGRNFWFYGDQLGPIDSFVTGFAIVNRFVSMEQIGADGADFGNLPFDEFKVSILEDLSREFFSGSPYSIENTLGAGQGVSNPNGWGGADFAASLLYQVYEDFGLATYGRFYRALGNLPAASSVAGSISNLIEAASDATGINYDFLHKAVGTAYIVGGRGDDALVADRSGNPVFGFGGDDTIEGSVRADMLFGDAGNDALSGGRGADRLIGGSGDDVLSGGTGNDLMYGGEGDDFYVVTDAGDKIREYADEGIDTVYAHLNYSLLSNFENLIMEANGGNWTAAGNKLNNVMTATRGDNVIDGASGADTMRGLAGNDIYIVDNKGDQVVEAAGEGSDTVKTSVSYTLTSGSSIENMRTTYDDGVKAINLTGNEIANRIVGNDGANLIAGGTGGDSLYGRGGADTFLFKGLADSAVAASGRDTIQDFNRAQGDRIDLHRIDAVNGKAGNQAFDFIGGAAFHEKAGELRAVASGSNTLVSGDVDGDGAADFSILLKGAVTLQAGDFVL